MDRNSKLQTDFKFDNSPCTNENIYKDENCKNVKSTINCITCSGEILIGEIVYYCICYRFFHPNCLTGYLKKICDECNLPFKLGCYDSESERNNSTLDTNINNLENYSEFYSLAMHMSHEGMVEKINKETNYTMDEFGRVALSPINFSNTPYSGKTKSGQKVGDYFKMQNTHTTPHNKSQNNNHSPISLNGIRQHLSFYSPNGGESPHSKKISFDNYYNYFSKNEFRKIIFEEDENETDTFSADKENQPPIPRESTKYNYFENDSGPLEINIEGGVSHIISNSNKVTEIPISIDIKINYETPNYTKDFIVIFNTRSLNLESIHHLIKLAYEKLTSLDRIFINILSIDKWLTKDELFNILDFNVFSELCIKEASYLNNTEIIQLINYCIDLSFEHYSNIFSIVMISDVEDLQTDYVDDLRIISNKICDSKVNLLKNFTINTIILNRNDSNVKSISFYFELSQLTLGYFYAPKNFDELVKSFNILITMFEQIAYINLKAIVKGNKDPSVYIDCINYPSIKPQHNYLEIYLGNLTKKEKKNLTLSSVVILNHPNVSLDLPILEVTLEYLGVKHNEFSLFTLNNYSNNLIKKKSNSCSISIPIIAHFREVIYSNSTYIKYLSSKIAEKLNTCIDYLKDGKEDDCYMHLIEARQFYENVRSCTPLFKFFEHSNYNLDFSESKFLSDNSIMEILKNMKSANQYKMFHFSMMILMDLNELIERVKSKTYTITEFYIIMQSLAYFRPVNLVDDRFVDDIIDLN